MITGQTKTARAAVLIACLLWLPARPALAGDAAIAGHESGIWSIAGTEQAQRWLVIHNLAEAGTSGIYHIEVIQRPVGAPAWQIERLAPHMAITEAALKHSIVKPLQRGAVYPEAFDDALRAWHAMNGGKGGNICHTSVLECLAR